MRAARMTVDAERTSVARSIANLARASARAGGPLVCVTGRAYGELAAERGGDDAAVRHLCRVESNTGRPIAVNLPTGPDTSTTAFIPPRGWSEERLAGWVAGHHEELEAVFGDATVIRTEDE